MKNKVLFANAGIAKFMALLVTLLTMFASCNFVGGQDARTTTAGVGDPGKNGGMFKSPIQGMGIQIYNKGDAFAIDDEGNLVLKSGWAGAYGSFDDKGASTTGIYDVSKVAYVKFDLKSDSEGSFGIQVFAKSENGWNQDFSKQDFDGKEYSEEEKMVCKKNLRIDIQNQPEYSEILFNLTGKMETGAKVRIENLAFYDENGKEIVPKYIKYAEGEKPTTPGNSGDGDGEGSTFNGIFKSPIIGVDLCVWDEPSWSDGMDIKGNSFTSGSNKAAGAHFGSMDPDTKSPDGIDPYDVSKIAYAKFKFECDADISASAFSVTLFGDSKLGEEVKISEAKANVEQVIMLDVLDNPGTNNTLFGVFIDVSQYGKQFKISDFAFYDKDGNEVVPKIVETN